MHSVIKAQKTVTNLRHSDIYKHKLCGIYIVLQKQLINKSYTQVAMHLTGIVYRHM